MYVRSSISSQIASWTDMGVGFVLFSLWGLYPWLATAIGAVAGGVLNCCINYKFTFRASGCSVKAVSVKYTIVWIGSLLLNTAGTALLYLLFDKWGLITALGLSEDGKYATARLFVSLIVSIFWNYLLQKNFVYVKGKYDPQCERLLDSAAEVIFFHHPKDKTNKK